MCVEHLTFCSIVLIWLAKLELIFKTLPLTICANESSRVGSSAMKIEYGDAVSDVLTLVLNALQFQGQVFCYTKLTSPWALRLKRNDFAHFHFFERGQGWVVVEETGTEIPVSSGDLVMMPHGVGHLMRDSRKSKAVNVEELLPCLDVFDFAARWRRFRNNDSVRGVYFREPNWKSYSASAA